MRIIKFFICTVYLLLANIAHGQQAPLVLGVQEGSGSSGDSEYSVNKYKPFAELISKYLKREVKVMGLSPARQYSESELKSVDVLFSRPSSVSGFAMVKLGFLPVISFQTNAPTKIVLVGEPLAKNLLDPKSNQRFRVVLPSEGDSHDVAINMLTQRHIKLSDVTLQKVTLQGTIPFALESKLADIGVLKSDSSVMQSLKANKFVVLAESEPLPPWALLASGRLGAEFQEKLKLIMMSMNEHPEQKAYLKTLRITGLIDFNEAAYLNMNKLHVSLK
ncbi:phosphate/phosphite/phosphonate ABC transporter substrate-binding protein [Undibacterium danionis]|uniref:Phosphate/phosphite/phosphonate ABC transporter substrate-binding protein n=1 Tax=Undibacterium danionis TaxID=1812100 RepID=A0ABV6ILM6_9BURK